MAGTPTYKAVVIGCSAGGLAVLSRIVTALPAGFPLPVLVVQHRYKDQRTLLEEILQGKSRARVQQAEEKEPINAGTVYIAPPDYHLLIESDHTLSLTYDPLVSHSRPSIDVLFESAAMVYGASLMGILLTGANRDGTDGLRAIAAAGGLTIAQAPNEAEYAYMPQSAINAGHVHEVLPLNGIIERLLSITAE